MLTPSSLTPVALVRSVPPMMINGELISQSVTFMYRAERAEHDFHRTLAAGTRRTDYAPRMEGDQKDVIRRYRSLQNAVAALPSIDDEFSLKSVREMQESVRHIVGDIVSAGLYALAHSEEPLKSSIALNLSPLEIGSLAQYGVISWNIAEQFSEAIVASDISEAISLKDAGEQRINVLFPRVMHEPPLFPFWDFPQFMAILGSGTFAASLHRAHLEELIGGAFIGLAGALIYKCRRVQQFADEYTRLVAQLRSLNHIITQVESARQLSLLINSRKPQRGISYDVSVPAGASTARI